MPQSIDYLITSGKKEEVRVAKSKIITTFAPHYAQKLINFIKRMNNYETVFIVTPVLSEAQVKEVADKFQGVITENGGQIVNVENWGLKKLAYPIQKKTTGFYFLVEFTGEGSIINTLETQYRRDERVIRFLTFKQDKFAVEYSQKRRAKLANKSQEE